MIASETSVPSFSTNVFRLEDYITSDSDGWGMEYAHWLKGELERAGYKANAPTPDTCCWHLEIPQEGFKLQINCMLMPASEAVNFKALDLGPDEHIWVTGIGSSKPFLKSLFGGLDTKPAEARLAQAITQSLEAHPGLNLFPEPDFDFSD